MREHVINQRRTMLPDTFAQLRHEYARWHHAQTVAGEI
jgi:hypothetical protein